MTKEEVYKKVFPKYMKWVNQVAEDIEDKTHFYPEEIVDKVTELVIHEMESVSKEWISFEKQLRPGSRKTDVYVVVNSQNGSQLGEIKWYSGFRKYVFSPYSHTIFDGNCLKQIQIFLNALMDERKTNNK